MKIFTNLNELPTNLKNTAVALGTFDGIHTGHQRIISRAVKLAGEAGGTSVVFTFSNHPLAVIDPRRSPPQIVTGEYKAELVERLGADILLSIPFTKEFLKLSPADFITLLRQHLSPRYLVVGPNYHYGYKGAGDPDTLKQEGIKHGFEVFVHPAVYEGDTLVSSTMIRQLIQAGDVGRAARLLGRPPRIGGAVIAGDGRGRTLGFPTANLAIDNQLVSPANGIYAVHVHTGGQRYAGVANIGVNPTFHGTNRHIEVFILEFTGDLYGHNLQLDILARLRDERSFASVEELKAQIALDIAAAYKYF